MGYYKKVGGADTFIPFNKGGFIPLSARAYHPYTNSNINYITLKYLDVKTMTVKTAEKTAYGSSGEYGYGSWSYTIDGISWNISVVFVTQNSTRVDASANDTIVGNTYSKSYTFNVNASYPYDASVSFSYE